MKPEAQRIAIAEACGWTVCQVDRQGATGIDPPTSQYPNGQLRPLPDYHNDLNAMHEAEKVLTNDQVEYGYDGELDAVIARDIENAPVYVTINDRACHATAAQRAEAFLRTLNLWRDDA